MSLILGVAMGDVRIEQILNNWVSKIFVPVLWQWLRENLYLVYISSSFSIFFIII